MMLIHFRNIALFFLLVYSSALFASPYPKDYQISDYVETQIAIDKSVKDLNIEVTTKNGVVTLVGLACSNAKAYKLIEITRCTTGVKEVDVAQLTLAYGRPISWETVRRAKSAGAFKQHHSLHCI